MQKIQSTPDNTGLKKLNRPILPLVRLFYLLFLTGPFSTIKELLTELPSEIEQGPINYLNPAALLEPYLDIIQDLERSKTSGTNRHILLDEKNEPIETMEGIGAWVCQQVLSRELAEINSLLCRPCGCALCCVGPEKSMSQKFFEIPLTQEEKALFPLEQVDTDISRTTTSEHEPPLTRKSQAFYKNSPALFHWRTGWSLILPQDSRCPHLEPEMLFCRIYPQRPDICRRPQIFPYLLERRPDLDNREDPQILPVYVIRNVVLAVWDCPYVRQFKDQIAAYAELSQLKPVFKSNKA